MRTRSWRSARAALLEFGLDLKVAEELHRAATGQQSTRRARATAEVAGRCVKAMLSGELDVDTVYRRVWGMGVDAYFATDASRDFLGATQR